MRAIWAFLVALFYTGSPYLNIKFKTRRIREEWQELHTKNFMLVSVVMAIAVFCRLEFGKSLVMTSIYRTAKEQKALAVRGGQGSSGLSTHCFWRAVDFRSWIFTKEEIEQIIEFINSSYIYDPERPDLKVVFYHNDSPKHFHIQIHKNTILAETKNG